MAGKEEEFGKIGIVREAYWAQKLLNEASASYFLERFDPGWRKAKPVPAWRLAWWRVRRFVKSIFYVECHECGVDLPRFWPQRD